MDARDKKITFASIIFFTMIFSLIGYVYVIEKEKNDLDDSGVLDFGQCPDGESCIAIYGNVKENAFIPISELNENGIFEYVDTQSYDWLNSYPTSDVRSLSGVQIYDVFLKSGVIPDNATYIKFESSDAYASLRLPIDIVWDNPSAVLLCDKEDDTPINEGPIVPFVKLDVIVDDPETQQIFSNIGEDFVYNSVYMAKYLIRIEII